MPHEPLLNERVIKITAFDNGYNLLHTNKVTIYYNLVMTSICQILTDCRKAPWAAATKAAKISGELWKKGLAMSSN